MRRQGMEAIDRGFMSIKQERGNAISSKVGVGKEKCGVKEAVIESTELLGLPYIIRNPVKTFFQGNAFVIELICR